MRKNFKNVLELAYNLFSYCMEEREISFIDMALYINQYNLVSFVETYENYLNSLDIFDCTREIAQHIAENGGKLEDVKKEVKYEPYNEDDARFRRMARRRAIYLMSWMIEESEKSKKNISVDNIVANFYASRTFAALMDMKTDWYWASENSLISLLKSDLIGDFVEWAIILRGY